MNYPAAIKAKNKVYDYLQSSGATEVGVGLTFVDEEDFAVTVNMVEPLSEEQKLKSQEIARQDGVEVQYEETGRAYAY